MAGSQRRSWGKLRRLPSGRWQASYVWPRDLDRHVGPITYTAKMDGEAWLINERRLIEQDRWTPPTLRAEVARHLGKTLGECAIDWLATRNVKPRTKIGYQSLFDNHIKDTLGTVPLAMLTSERVRTWFASLGTAHPTRNSHAYGLVHAICATALTDGLLSANPCTIARVMNPPTKRRAVMLDIDDVAKLANTIAPDRLKAFVLVSAWCGLRRGEVIELRRKDIGPDCSIITVSRGVTHRNGCRIDSPKSGKGRTVVVPPHIRADLADHLEVHVTKDGDALLFPPARNGCHLNDRVMRDYLAPALKAIGREGVRIHDLRHFAGTQAARVGNLVETMARLGHSTPKASLAYQQVVNGRDVEVAEALSLLATSAGAREVVAETETAQTT